MILESDSDRSSEIPTILLKVLNGILDAILTLFTRSSSSDPSEDFVTEIDNEDIILVEHIAFDSGTLSDLGDLHLSRSIAETKEDTRRSTLLESKIIATFLSSSIRTLAKAINPFLGPFLGLGGLVKDDDLRDGATLVIESTANLRGLVTFEDSGVLAIELDDEKAKIKDKHITAVDRLGIERDFDEADALAALNLEETRLVLLGLDLVEAGVNATLHDADALGEVALEEIRFVTLDLAVLDWTSTEIVVELDSLVSSDAHFVLRSLVSKPEVDIPFEVLTAGATEGVEDDVRIAAEEGSVGALVLGDDVELLDTPDLQTDVRASLSPLLGDLLLGCLALFCNLVFHLHLCVLLACTAKFKCTVLNHSLQK